MRHHVRDHSDPIARYAEAGSDVAHEAIGIHAAGGLHHDERVASICEADLRKGDGDKDASTPTRMHVGDDDAPEPVVEEAGAAVVVAADVGEEAVAVACTVGLELITREHLPETFKCMHTLTSPRQRRSETRRSHSPKLARSQSSAGWLRLRAQPMLH